MRHLIFLVTASIFLFQNCAQKKEDYPILYLKQLDSAKSILKEGDVVFRGGTDIESEIIRDFSKQDKLFSHAGIVLEQNGILKVFHVLGGITNISGCIKIESIDSFVKYPSNESLGIYSSLLNKQQLTVIKHFMDSLIHKNVKFDLKFNLFTKDELYCTELLIDAFTNTDSLAFKFQPTNFYVKGTKYQLLMNYQDSFSYYPIDKFQHSIYFRQKKIFLFPNFQGH